MLWYTAGFEPLARVCLSLPCPEVSGICNLTKCGILYNKKRKLWVIKAVNRRTRKTVGWMPGGRGSGTFRRLYNKVGHLKNCTFYTDKRDTFAEVLPTERHIVGKAHTVEIERDNSNTRHHLGRFTRRTKVVSQKEFMVDLILRIRHAVTTTDLFFSLRETALYIFK
jgi:insertion element IS1 protein InsB